MKVSPAYGGKDEYCVMLSPRERFCIIAPMLGCHLFVALLFCHVMWRLADIASKGGDSHAAMEGKILIGGIALYALFLAVVFLLTFVHVSTCYRVSRDGILREDGWGRSVGPFSWDDLIHIEYGIPPILHFKNHRLGLWFVPSSRVVRPAELNEILRMAGFTPPAVGWRARFYTVIHRRCAVTRLES